MAAKKATTVSPQIRAKARAVLAFAEQQAAEAADWVELSNALFGLGGKATIAFPSERERTAFCKTEEYKRLLALMDRLPAPPVKEVMELAPRPTVPSACACPARSMPPCWPKPRRKASA